MCRSAIRPSMRCSVTHELSTPWHKHGAKMWNIEQLTTITINPSPWLQFATYNTSTHQLQTDLLPRFALGSSEVTPIADTSFLRCSQPCLEWLQYLHRLKAVNCGSHTHMACASRAAKKTKNTKMAMGFLGERFFSIAKNAKANSQQHGRPVDGPLDGSGRLRAVKTAAAPLMTLLEQTSSLHCSPINSVKRFISPIFVELLLFWQGLPRCSLTARWRDPLPGMSIK